MKHYNAFGTLMEFNFSTRVGLYGNNVIGEDNIKLFEIASEIGCPAKLSGSGGAVVGLYRNEQYEPLAQAYEQAGYKCVKVVWDQ